MTTFSTRCAATTTLLAAAGLLVAGPALAGVRTSTASRPAASHPTKAQVEYEERLAAAHAHSAADDYVASLLRRHEASTPYNAMEDYVRTLIFWHEHPFWTVGP